jgi:predicted nucleic acid-binding protein
MPERVIDASVAVAWVLHGEPFQAEARRLLADAQSTGIDLIGPPLLLYEVESVLQRKLYTGQAPVATVDVALAAFYTAGVRVETHPDMVKRAREIARLCNQVRIYDSLYAALAELRSCDLWTGDGPFFSAVSPSLPFVKHIQHYP